MWFALSSLDQEVLRHQVTKEACRHLEQVANDAMIQVRAFCRHPTEEGYEELRRLFANLDIAFVKARPGPRRS
jgi:hypothetical protein